MIKEFTSSLFSLANLVLICLSWFCFSAAVYASGQLPKLVDSDRHLNLELSASHKTQLAQFCNTIKNQRQNFVCRSQCVAIHDKLTTFSQHLGRKLNHNILLQTAKTYAKTAAGCIKLFPQNKVPAPLMDHVALLQWMNAGGKPEAALIHTPGAKPKPQNKYSSNTVVNSPFALTQEQIRQRNLTRYRKESDLLPYKLKTLPDIEAWLKRLVAEGERLDELCLGINKQTQKLLNHVNENASERRIKRSASQLSNALKKCEPRFVASEYRGAELTKRYNYLNAHAYLTGAATRFEQTPDFYKRELAKIKPGDFGEELRFAPPANVAAQVTVEQLSMAMGNVAKRCSQSGHQQCQANCASVSSQALDIHQKLPQLELVGYQNMRAQLDILDEQMRQCFSAIYSLEEHYISRKVIGDLRDWMKEDAWPIEFKVFAIANRPPLSIEPFEFVAPTPAPHVVFAQQYFVDENVPAFRVTKRSFKYEDVLAAYEYVAAKGCGTVKNQANCEFRCGLNKTKRQTIANAFDRKADRYKAAGEIKATQCASTLATSSLKGKNKHIDTVLAFQHVLEYGLFPEDVRPYENEVRMYCKQGSKSPFVGIKGCEYLSAIYYSDFGKAAKLDHRAGEPLAQLTDTVSAGLQQSYSSAGGGLNSFMGLMVEAMGNNISNALRHSFSLSNVILQTYLTSYEKYFSKCLGDDPISVTITQERVREYKNAWGTTTRTEQLPSISYTYRFKRKFEDVASSHGMNGDDPIYLGLLDWFARNLDGPEIDRYSAAYTTDYMAETGVSMNEAVAGTFELLNKKSCDDAVILRLEDQLIKYSTEFFPKYYKLANDL